MSDFIPRQHALNVLSEVAIDNFSLSDSFEVYLKALNDASERIKKIPSVQPEQKKGKWVVMSELKPCPFCGGKMTVSGSSRLRRFTISHKNLRSCYFYSFEIDWQTVGSLAEAIKAWNRRDGNG